MIYVHGGFSISIVHSLEGTQYIVDNVLDSTT